MRERMEKSVLWREQPDGTWIPIRTLQTCPYAWEEVEGFVRDSDWRDAWRQRATPSPASPADDAAGLPGAAALDAYWRDRGGEREEGS